MKRYILLLVFACSCLIINAQPLPDSVKVRFNTAKTDSEKGRILTRYFELILNDDQLLNELITLKNYFQSKNNSSAENYTNLAICRQLSRASEYNAALNELFPLLSIFEKRKDAYGVMVTNRHLSYAYYAAGDENKTIYYDKKTLELSLQLNDDYELALAYNNLSSDYSEYGFSDSGFVFGQKAIAIARNLNDPIILCRTTSTFGESYLSQKKYDEAIPYLRESFLIAKDYSRLDACFVLNDFSKIYYEKKQFDSAKYYATLAIPFCLKGKFDRLLLRSYQNIYLAYENIGPLDSSFKYFKLFVSTKDTIYSADKVKQLQAIDIREQNRQQLIEQEKLQYKNKVRLYALLGGLLVIIIIALILYRNNLQRKKANNVLHKQKEKIENTLHELKSTQQQLIQSEKMASLGELTAGIAHEIQNPLNFVNNFSEVNKEMLVELNDEIEKGNFDDAKAIAKDVIANEEKINHHGKRADAIVKGMLQHSRKNSGQKEPTDINALCDEYLRLSYHGLRAKDKNFNADFKIDFDETIGKINIVPQDIGRVLLNLVNNAFYAVNEKIKAADKNYQPTVSIQTKKINDKVEIRVEDNGNGIPQNIIDKIFQPFFTTKPTGQGTGLGLSLAYDIITKEHNGTIKVESKENVGSTFTIQLPAKDI
ncbi:MAG: ATP-binding protein [Parafilimonas sp.]